MKKLLLTSDGFENHKIAEKFVELIAKDVDKAKIFFVPTAAYGEETMSYVYESEKELLDIGVLKENIIWAEDLQNTDLNDYDVIYVCGGNTFYLLNEIRNTGFDKKLSIL
jgi:dipeptidase E